MQNRFKGEKEKVLRKYTTTDIFIYCFVFLFLMVYLCFMCNYGLPSFDGAMNLQVPKNLVENGEYATDYPTYTLFDGKIQTGAPVLFPIAFLMLLFGKSFTAVLFVNAFYIALLVMAAAFIIRRKRYASIWFLLIFMILFFTPYFWNYGFGVYGEISGLSFVLAGTLFPLKDETHVYELIQNGKKKNNIDYFICGLFIGLAVLTKTVLLICFASMLLVFFINLIMRKMKMRQILFYIVGFIVPLLLFELYKLSQIGISEYIHFWDAQLNAILQQAGVKTGLSDTGDRWVKLITHFNLYIQYFNIFGIASIVSLFTGAGVVIYSFVKKKQLSVLDGIWISGAVYIFWWMVITPTSKAWARRIINGNVLFTLSLVLNAAALGKLFEDKLNRKVRKISTCVFTVLIAVVICINGYFSLSTMNSNSREKVEEAAEYISNLKGEDSTAVLCGNAWYQAPIISFAAGESFSDFSELRKHDRVDFSTSNYYLITDNYKSYPESELSMFESTQLYGKNNPLCSVYWIKGYIPYNKLFSQQDLSSEHISLLKKDSDYRYVKGIYGFERENKTRWVQKYSGMVLDYHSESDLLISFYVPAYNKRNKDEADFIVYINGDTVYEQHITHGGNYTDRINLQDINLQEGPQIVTVLFNSCVITGDERELSWCLDSIGFVDSSPSKNEDSKGSTTVYTLPAEKTLVFSGSDSVLIQTNSSAPFSRFSFEMDLCIEDL